MTYTAGMLRAGLQSVCYYWLRPLANVEISVGLFSLDARPQSVVKNKLILQPIQVAQIIHSLDIYLFSFDAHFISTAVTLQF